VIRSFDGTHEFASLTCCYHPCRLVILCGLGFLHWGCTSIVRNGVSSFARRPVAAIRCDNSALSPSRAQPQRSEATGSAPKTRPGAQKTRSDSCVGTRCSRIGCQTDQECHSSRDAEWQTSFFVRARLQPCRNGRQVKKALAAEGLAFAFLTGSSVPTWGSALQFILSLEGLRHKARRINAPLRLRKRLMFFSPNLFRRSLSMQFRKHLSWRLQPIAPIHRSGGPRSGPFPFQHLPVNAQHLAYDYRVRKFVDGSLASHRAQSPPEFGVSQQPFNRCPQSFRIPRRHE